MDADDELRARLARLESGVEPDLERQHAAVVNRARRREGRMSVGVAIRDLAITAAVIVVVVTGFALRGAGPASQPPTLQSVAWTTTLDATDVDATAEGVTGTWTMRFEPSGALTVVAPPTYLAPTTGYRYQADGDQIVIGLFVERCAGVAPGMYRFAIEATALRFTAIDDGCAHRRALLSARPWRPAPPDGS